MSILIASALLVAASKPALGVSPSQPPVITTVKASAACAALRKNVYVAVGGLLANDALMNQGKLLVAKVVRDASADPENAAATGGAGPSSALDDVRLQQVVMALSNNVRKIEIQLNDTNVFPSDRPMDVRLENARSALRNVLAAQETELNVLSMDVDTNQLMDLGSRRSPIDAKSFHAPTAVRLSDFGPFGTAMQRESSAETSASAAVTQLVEACR